MVIKENGRHLEQGYHPVAEDPPVIFVTTIDDREKGRN